MMPSAVPTAAGVPVDDGDDDFCFHVEFKIDYKYKGVKYTYEECTGA